ncbi:glycosyltransferase family 2 protein [Winogradskyella ursingii]|uniref:glycosyltransferase family 2 protein n=1 Tax=Winogradskyella ursingii TaxID=2686079 RepID=UPI0015C79DE4|nr:glycosyltransferase family A protein [Winogradskyella ursingii]
MLSILIPVYNYNVLPLVEEIHKQGKSCNKDYEIVIIDDASSQLMYSPTKIENLNQTKLIILDNNIGRSAIRNLLASKATFENLLFIDAGTMPYSADFLSNYLNHIKEDIVIGGMKEEHVKPKKPYRLRWLYTKKKEACCEHGVVKRRIYTSANFLIKKRIVKTFPFDETITTYGYEDFVFFKSIEANGYDISFIDNPVIHDSKESADRFIEKTKQSLRNLLVLEKNKNMHIKEVKIKKWHSIIGKFGLNWLIAFIFKISKPLLKMNFNSNYPSIILFDFYKLGYLCSITSKTK